MVREVNDNQFVEGKYRVFYGPDPQYIVSARYMDEDGAKTQLPEVTGFVFVLRPDVDDAAKVALAAYAAAVADHKPGLARDLWLMMSEWYDSEEDD